MRRTTFWRQSRDRNVFKQFVFIVALVSFLSVAHADDNNKPLTGRDLEDATKMNDIYARHMYSSTCMERQKSLYTPKTLSPAEIAARMEKYKESCDCMTNEILKKFTPNDVIGYVTQLDGVLPPNVKSRAKPDSVTAKKYFGISALNREIRTRQQCGFKQ